jgi:hypothetical protein
MSWEGLANNQTVSFNNINDALFLNVFVFKSLIVVSNVEQITKSEADTYVYLDTSYAPFAAKTNNQLVVKSDLQPSLNAINLSAEVDTLDETCTVSPFATPKQTVTFSGTLGVGTQIDSVTIFGNLGYFRILGPTIYEGYSIGINDDGEVTYFQFYCPV